MCRIQCLKGNNLDIASDINIDINNDTI